MNFKRFETKNIKNENRPLNKKVTFTLVEDIEVHNELNQDLWDKNNELKPDVRETIENIVDLFISSLAEDGVELIKKDITIVGSSANYNYNSASDIDIHIIADGSLDCSKKHLDALYRAYKLLFNSKYDFTIKGHEAEVYVELDRPHVNSNGIYSFNNGWLKEPIKKDIPDIDEDKLKSDLQPFIDRANAALKKDGAKTVIEINEIIDDLYKVRQASLLADGEFGIGNLVFKEFRAKGYMDKLKEKRVELINKTFSLEALEEGLGDVTHTNPITPIYVYDIDASRPVLAYKEQNKNKLLFPESSLQELADIWNYDNSSEASLHKLEGTWWLSPYYQLSNDEMYDAIVNGDAKADHFTCIFLADDLKPFNLYRFPMFWHWNTAKQKPISGTELESYSGIPNVTDNQLHIIFDNLCEHNGEFADRMEYSFKEWLDCCKGDNGIYLGVDYHLSSSRGFTNSRGNKKLEEVNNILEQNYGDEEWDEIQSYLIWNDDHICAIINCWQGSEVNKTETLVGRYATVKDLIAISENNGDHSPAPFENDVIGNLLMDTIINSAHQKSGTELENLNESLFGLDDETLRFIFNNLCLNNTRIASETENNFANWLDRCKVIGGVDLGIVDYYYGGFADDDTYGSEKLAKVHEILHKKWSNNLREVEMSLKWVPNRLVVVLDFWTNDKIVDTEVIYGKQMSVQELKDLSTKGGSSGLFENDTLATVMFDTIIVSDKVQSGTELENLNESVLNERYLSNHGIIRYENNEFEKFKHDYKMLIQNDFDIGNIYSFTPLETAWEESGHSIEFYGHGKLDLSCIQLRGTELESVEQLREDIPSLSLKQDAFFKNSKVRDEQGVLYTCYRGTMAEDSLDGKILWFTIDKDYANRFADVYGKDGKLMSCYLACTSIFEVGKVNAKAKNGMQVSDDMNHIITKLGLTLDLFEKEFEKELETASTVLDIITTNKFADLVYRAGYDCIKTIEGDDKLCFGVLDKTMVKYIDDRTPTKHEIKESFTKDEKLKQLRDMYLGKEIIIHHVEGEHGYDGKTGIVDHVDDGGQLFGSWGGIGLAKDYGDDFKIISKKGTELE